MKIKKIFLILFFIFGCSHAQKKYEYPFHHTFMAMGTPWIIHAHFKSAEPLDLLALQEEISSLVLLFDQTFSDWSAESELRTYEKKGLTSWHRASKLFLEGLYYSQLAYYETDGLFDPTTGAVLWKESNSVPGWDLELDLENKRFRFNTDPIRLTFGGIAKGFAVGAVSEVLLQYQASSFSVDAGGGNLAFFNIKYKNQLKKDQILFVSRSGLKRPLSDQVNIISPKPNITPQHKQIELICFAKKNKNLRMRAAQNDALSTAYIIQKFTLPEHCNLI